MTEKKFGRTQDLNFREELNNVPLAVYNVCLYRAQSSAHNHHDPCVIVCLLCLYTREGPANNVSQNPIWSKYKLWQQF